MRKVQRDMTIVHGRKTTAANGDDKNQEEAIVALVGRHYLIVQRQLTKR
jgi:hypothetical protein